MNHTWASIASLEDHSEIPLMTLSNSAKPRKSVFYASPENTTEDETLPSSTMPQPRVERHASVQSHNKISLLNEQQTNDIPQPNTLMLQMLQRRMPWRLSRSMSMNLPMSLPIYGERKTSLNCLTKTLRTCVVGGCDRFQCRAGYCQSHAEAYLSAELGPDAMSGSGIENYDEIPFEDIKLDEVIGNGAFGKVYRAHLWGQVVAVKMLRPSKREDSEDIEDLIMKEAAIMRSLRHPNIVEFMGIARERNGRIAIVTELLESGGLDDYLLKRKKLSWKRYFEIAKDIACGLNWLHRKGIIHRDLKPSNILISRNMNAKIADFGLSHVRKHPYLKGGHYGVAGTPCYISPEVLREEPYDTKADVFSFGVVLCEMLTGSYPFATLYDMKMPQSCFENSIISGERPRIPDDCHPALRDLINECWRGNPRQRPTMGQVLPMLEDCERVMLKAQRFVLEEALNEHLPEDVRAALEDQRLIYEEAQTELKAVKLSVTMLNLKKTELENELRASEEAIQMAILQRDRYRSNFYRAQQELDRLHGNNRGDGMGQRFQQTYRPRPLKRTLSSQRRFFAERMRRS